MVQVEKIGKSRKKAVFGNLGIMQKKKKSGKPGRPRGYIREPEKLELASVKRFLKNKQHGDSQIDARLHTSKVPGEDPYGMHLSFGGRRG
jgi:hypothetical protein